MLIDYYLEIFSQTCISLISWIPGIVAMWFLIHMVSSLLFKE